MLQNLTKGSTVARRLSLADTFGKRLRGLMGRAELPQGEGLLITPCNSIHTFFMRFPIDVLFIDEHRCVVHLIPALKPYRLSPLVRAARSVVELPAGTIARTRTETGDRLGLRHGISPGTSKNNNGNHGVQKDCTPGSNPF